MLGHGGCNGDLLHHEDIDWFLTFGYDLPPKPPIRLTPRRPGPYTRHGRMRTTLKSLQIHPVLPHQGNQLGEEAPGFVLPAFEQESGCIVAGTR